MSPILENSDAPIRDEDPHLATSDLRFKRILVGTDFSRPAAQALKTAIAISQLFGSQMFLVHAVSPFVYQQDGSDPPRGFQCEPRCCKGGDEPDHLE